MFAKYDAGKDSYLCGEALVPRLDILNTFNVRFDTAREIQQMLIDAHTVLYDKPPCANKLHMWTLAHMSSERHLPAWICEAYAKRRQ